MTVTDLIDAANVARRSARMDRSQRRRADDAERQLEALFGCSERLGVYGSLAPGKENHHIVEPLGGVWSQGVVEGDLTRHGWGAAMGYFALHLRSGGPAVPVHVLASPALPAAWSRIDAFEGAEYRRVLAAVWSAAGDSERVLLAVANLYESTGVEGGG
jgi:gamma-glutamylcyclotransferase (GGCT)/AIG2-like uncharacterized protein YtfP